MIRGFRLLKLQNKFLKANNIEKFYSQLFHKTTGMTDDDKKCVVTNEIFVQSLNPMTGRREWKMVPEDYDYQQEVARAAFADMLHDLERNHLYYVGLESAIKKKRAEGSEVHVLDIGTGTGLLAMMAARIGADSVTAIEEFRPMADCAEKIIELNGFSGQIQLIRKRSTEVRVGHEMQRRANILVTEVFDTELIGEGAIATFNLAHKHLLTEDCLVVPCQGVLYAQVVSSDMASRWNQLHPIHLGSENWIQVDSASNSSSSLALHDLQLTQMKKNWFKPITQPLKVFGFNFGAQNGSPIPVRQQTEIQSKAIDSGRCDAVFMWWDITMDPDHKVVLSCAPKWAHPKPDDMPWRDHWMQAVYYPIRTPDVAVGQDLTVISNHDEYSLWFDVEPSKLENAVQVPMPKPTGGIHLAASRPRLGQINDSTRNAKYLKAFKNIFKAFWEEEKRLPNCLCLSELSMLPLMAAATLSSVNHHQPENDSSGKIYVCERNHQMRHVLSECAKTNASLVKDRLVFIDNFELDELDPQQIPEKLDIVFGEPHFSINFLPWHNLLFWYSAQKFIRQNHKLVLMPRKAELWAVPVHYEDLWKIRAPVENVEGFKMEHFDKIIMSACDRSDANVEPHPLWEYPCQAVGPATKLMTFDLTEQIPNENVTAQIEIEIDQSLNELNGMALWMDWQLLDGPDSVVSSGPVEPVTVGKNIEWDVHSKQGVHFIQRSSDKTDGPMAVSCLVTFKPKEGDLEFKFNRKL